jgi:hypothetical protein
MGYLAKNPTAIYMTGAFFYMPQPEAKLVKKIQNLIQVEGGRSFKIHGEDTFQEVGIPDLLCCLWGIFIGVEVKLPGEPLRPMQVVALREIYHSGGVAAVVETAKQAIDLLSTAEREINLAKTRSRNGMLFDRGRWSRSFILRR